MEPINYPMILDGGLSNVLEDFGCDLNHELWSAKLLQTDPELLVKAHLTYLEAGARCITTSSYQATVEGFMDFGIAAQEAEKLLLSSVTLAEKARDLYYKQHGFTQKIYIAASMGPYGAFLADGSEYTGNYAISEEALKDFHNKRIQLFETTGADFFAFETVPSFLEVKVLSELLDQCTRPSWMSFSCKDEFHLNDGTRIEEAAALLANKSQPFAIGVNCTPPKFISEIIDQLKKSAPHKKIIVYPNSGEVYHVESKSWIGVSDPSGYEKMVTEWRKKGADIIGGCCRIGPDHIKRISGLQ
jgi:homocysteine S-methyltransferase